MRTLYDIYFPSEASPSKTGVGPAAIAHCCSTTATDSPLCSLYRDVLIVYWHDNDVVKIDQSIQREWNRVWNEHADFRNQLLLFTSQTSEARSTFQQGLDYYLEKSSVAAEPALEETQS
jgi:hypothetical protein